MEILEIAYYSRFLLLFIFVLSIAAFMKYAFIPYYKMELREKIKQWIVDQHLDSSGRKMKIDTSLESNYFFKCLETMDMILTHTTY